MLITRLELKGYTRLMLGAADHITFTPTSRLQIIVGTNGCGKSSLLAQLSPLPGSTQEFRKDGFKKIWIQHQGLEYYLESTFKNGARHSFIKAGEELNPGQTGQVQKELAKLEFGWTQALHDLITGLDRFTDMGPSKRREWIMQLSTANYQYATKVFNNIYSKQRDAQGTLKHLEGRIATEHNRLKALDASDGLEERVEQLRSELNTLLMTMDSTLPSGQRIASDLTQQLATMNQLAQQILSAKLPAQLGEFGSYERLVDAENRAQHQLEHQQELLNRATREYADLESQAAQFGSADIDVPEDLDTQLLDTAAKIETQRQKLQLFHEIPSAKTALDLSLQIQNQWHQIFSQLPNNENREYSPERADAATQAIRTAEATVDRSTARLTVIHHRRQVLTSIKETACPQCSHVWREGYTQKEIDQLDAWEAEHTAIIEQMQEEIGQHKTYLDRYHEVSALYAQLRGLINGYPVLGPLWSRVLEEKLHLNRPLESLGLIRTWLSDCQTVIELESLQERLGQLQLMAQRKADGTLNHLAYRRQQLTQEIETITQAIHTQRARQTEIQTIRRQVDNFLNRSKGLSQTVKAFERLCAQSYQAAANAHIETQVSQHQNEMAHIQRNLTELQTLRGIVEDLETSREEVKARHLALSILTNELSPISGLIAEDISGFINCIVEQINAVISSIWTNDLEVLPCDMEIGEDLKYRFPLSSGQGAPVQDVSKGSTAQKDVVNFAFVLMVLMYLDFGEVPLFLDELGASFDPQHRINVMGFVKQLVDSQRYSQVFMISHYASSYSAMSGAQILVLDGTNVAVPQHHNDHVVIA